MRQTEPMQGRPMGDATMAGRDTAASHLARLRDLHDFEVADGDPDVRGWAVKTADGRTVGTVDTLIVDTRALKVRYLDVALDRRELKLDAERHVLLPIGGARLDEETDDVILDAAMAADLARGGGNGHHRRAAAPRSEGRRSAVLRSRGSGAPADDRRSDGPAEPRS